jgi:hypothetical protein
MLLFFLSEELKDTGKSYIGEGEILGAKENTRHWQYPWVVEARMESRTVSRAARLRIRPETQTKGAWRGITEKSK